MLMRIFILFRTSIWKVTPFDERNVSKIEHESAALERRGAASLNIPS